MKNRRPCESRGNVSCVQFGHAFPRGSERYPIAALNITGKAMTRTK